MDEIQKLMAILEKALGDQDKGIPMPRKDFGITHGAMIDLSKQEYEPAKKYFVKLLDNPLPYIKQESLISLARYPGDKKYHEFVKRKAIELFHTNFDSDDELFTIGSEMKFTAMNVLSGFENHQDPELVQLFYSTLLDASLEMGIRSSALIGIYNTTNVVPKKATYRNAEADIFFKFSISANEYASEEFEKYIDWNEVKSIVKEYLSDIED